MHDAIDMLKDLESCWALIGAQAATNSENVSTIASHAKTIDELSGGVARAKPSDCVPRP